MARPAHPLPALVALGLLVPHPAPASVVHALPLEALVARADVVAVAVVDSAAASWVDGRIVTDSVLIVEEALAGAAVGERLVVRTLGGERDGIGQRVFGEPWLRPGRRYLVFLEPLPSGGVRPLRRPVGMAQGVLPVSAVAEGTIVSPSPDLPTLVEPGLEASVGAWLDAPRPLDDVLGEVREAVRRREGGE